jgi:hypothetical protein
MRISGDFEAARGIALTDEYRARVVSGLTNPEASHPFRTMRPIPEPSCKIAARRCKSPMIGKHRWLFDNSLNLCRKVAGLPGNNWG